MPATVNSNTSPKWIPSLLQYENYDNQQIYSIHKVPRPSLAMEVSEQPASLKLRCFMTFKVMSPVT